MHLYRSSQKNTGFSLIELMVALTIFSIVMTVAVGTLLVLIDANAKAQALSSSMTNLSFAIDSITRNLRTGKNFYCTNGATLNGSALPNDSTIGNCTGSSNNNAIVFTPGFQSTTRMAYRLNGSAIEQWIDKTGPDGWVAITSTQPPAAVNVSALRFTLNGSADTSSSDYVQPRISIYIAGTVQNGLVDVTPFKVQSNVTQRVLNY